MYRITQLRDGQWYCEGRLQDGTQRWLCSDRPSAVQSMIQFARTTNGTYIRERDITFHTEQPEPYTPLTDEQKIMLAQLHNGRKILIDPDDKRVKYRITDEECDLIIRFREGDIYFIERGKK